MARASGAVVTNPAIPHTTISGCAARLISLKSSVYVRGASDSGEMSSFRHAAAGSVSPALGVSVKSDARKANSPGGLTIAQHQAQCSMTVLLAYCCT